MLRNPDLEEYGGNQIHPQPPEYQNLNIAIVLRLPDANH